MAFSAIRQLLNDSPSLSNDTASFNNKASLDSPQSSASPEPSPPSSLLAALNAPPTTSKRRLDDVVFNLHRKSNQPPSPKTPRLELANLFPPLLGLSDLQKAAILLANHGRPPPDLKEKGLSRLQGLLAAPTRLASAQPLKRPPPKRTLSNASPAPKPGCELTTPKLSRHNDAAYYPNIQCILCSEWVCSRNRYMHIESHLQYRPYKCSICMYDNRKEIFIQLHLKRTHKGEGKVVYEPDAELEQRAWQVAEQCLQHTRGVLVSAEKDETAEKASARVDPDVLEPYKDVYRPKIYNTQRYEPDAELEQRAWQVAEQCLQHTRGVLVSAEKDETAEKASARVDPDVLEPYKDVYRPKIYNTQRYEPDAELEQRAWQVAEQCLQHTRGVLVSAEKDETAEKASARVDPDVLEPYKDVYRPKIYNTQRYEPDAELEQRAWQVAEQCLQHTRGVLVSAEKDETAEKASARVDPDVLEPYKDVYRPKIYNTQRYEPDAELEQRAWQVAEQCLQHTRGVLVSAEKDETAEKASARVDPDVLEPYKDVYRPKIYNTQRYEPDAELEQRAWQVAEQCLQHTRGVLVSAEKDETAEKASARVDPDVLEPYKDVYRPKIYNTQRYEPDAELEQRAWQVAEQCLQHTRGVLVSAEKDETAEKASARVDPDVLEPYKDVYRPKIYNTQRYEPDAELEQRAWQVAEQCLQHTRGVLVSAEKDETAEKASARVDPDVLEPYKDVYRPKIYNTQRYEPDAELEQRAWQVAEQCLQHTRGVLVSAEKDETAEKASARVDPDVLEPYKDVYRPKIYNTQRYEPDAELEQRAWQVAEQCLQHTRGVLVSAEKDETAEKASARVDPDVLEPYKDVYRPKIYNTQRAEKSQLIEESRQLGLVPDFSEVASKEELCRICSSHILRHHIVLEEHVRTHLPQATYQCNISACHVSHESKNFISRHMKEVHKYRRQPLDLLEERGDLVEEFVGLCGESFPDVFDGDALRRIRFRYSGTRSRTTPVPPSTTTLQPSTSAPTLVLPEPGPGTGTLLDLLEERGDLVEEFVGLCGESFPDVFDGDALRRIRFRYSGTRSRTTPVPPSTTTLQPSTSAPTLVLPEPGPGTGTLLDLLEERGDLVEEFVGLCGESFPDVFDGDALRRIRFRYSGTRSRTTPVPPSTTTLQPSTSAPTLVLPEPGPGTGTLLDLLEERGDLVEEFVGLCGESFPDVFDGDALRRIRFRYSGTRSRTTPVPPSTTTLQPSTSAPTLVLPEPGPGTGTLLDLLEERGDLVEEFVGLCGKSFPDVFDGDALRRIRFRYSGTRSRTTPVPPSTTTLQPSTSAPTLVLPEPGPGTGTLLDLLEERGDLVEEFVGLCGESFPDVFDGDALRRIRFRYSGTRSRTTPVPPSTTTLQPSTSAPTLVLPEPGPGTGTLLDLLEERGDLVEEFVGLCGESFPDVFDGDALRRIRFRYSGTRSRTTPVPPSTTTLQPSTSAPTLVLPEPGPGTGRTCQLCQASLGTDFAGLLDHILSHVSRASFLCLLCAKSESDQGKLLEHAAEAHPGKSPHQIVQKILTPESKAEVNFSAPSAPKGGVDGRPTPHPPNGAFGAENPNPSPPPPAPSASRHVELSTALLALVSTTVPLWRASLS